MPRLDGADEPARALGRGVPLVDLALHLEGRRRAGGAGHAGQLAKEVDVLFIRELRGVEGHRGGAKKRAAGAQPDRDAEQRNGEDAERLRALE